MANLELADTRGSGSVRSPLSEHHVVPNLSLVNVSGRIFLQQGSSFLDASES
jgi:hypothetical protein